MIRKTHSHAHTLKNDRNRKMTKTKGKGHNRECYTDKCVHVNASVSVSVRDICISGSQAPLV